MKKKSLSYLLITITILFFGSSCKKEKVENNTFNPKEYNILATIPTVFNDRVTAANPVIYTFKDQGVCSYAHLWGINNGYSYEWDGVSKLKVKDDNNGSVLVFVIENQKITRVENGNGTPNTALDNISLQKIPSTNTFANKTFKGEVTSKSMWDGTKQTEVRTFTFNAQGDPYTTRPLPYNLTTIGNQAFRFVSSSNSDYYTFGASINGVLYLVEAGLPLYAGKLAQQ